MGKRKELYDSCYVEEDVEEVASEDVLPTLAFEVVLTHVSSHFREIAISTRALWTFLHVTTGRSTEELGTYITRSNGSLLRVRIDDDNPTAETREKIKSILPHFNRYQQVVIHTIRESTEIPVIRCFSDHHAPCLTYLSVSVEELEGGVVGTETNLLAGGAPILSFVRLRGLAVSFFKPPLQFVTTLHLDQTLTFPIQYATFRRIIAEPPFLKNLSFYGDIVGLGWPTVLTPIDLPNLRSLRICGIGGAIYSRLLLELNAPGLNSLVLKDVQEPDLDQFWVSPDIHKFPLLQHLSFNGFEVSTRAYTDVFRAFPDVAQFSTTYSVRTPTILHLLARENMNQLEDVPWPNLHTLNLLIGLNGGGLIKDVVETRISCGHPLKKLRVGMRTKLSLLPHYYWLKDAVELEELKNMEQWPGDSSHFDPDDDLFY